MAFGIDDAAEVGAVSNPGFLSAAFSAAVTFAVGHTAFMIGAPILAPGLYEAYAGFTAGASESVGGFLTGGESTGDYTFEA